MLILKRYGIARGFEQPHGNKLPLENGLQELLNHPAVQGGVAPFVVALLVAELLQRMRLSGLAVIAGFAVMVYLASDFSLEPLTATRKIILLGLLSSALAVLLTLFDARWLRPLLSVAAGGAAVWVVSRIAQQQETGLMLLMGGACAAYAAWLVFWFDGLRDASPRAASAGVALGLGSGGAALLGGSALLGQFGMALGAAAAAYLLIQMLTGARLPCGRTFTLPLSLIAALSGSFAVLSATLPWYTLLLLATIPLAAKLPVPEKQPLWIQSLLLSAVPLLCAAGAIYLTWRVAGAPPL